MNSTNLSSDTLAQLSVVLEGGQVECRVCPRHCRLRPTQLGRCRVRVGSHNTVVPLSSQAYVARGHGKVEDHPLFHFHPGMRTVGLGCVGCTAACAYCQNWELALAPLVSREWTVQPDSTSPDEIVENALRQNCGALAFTYNEPTVWIEALYTISQRARRTGLKVILVTNGFVTETALDVLLPHIDAVKLDLKGPDDSFYQTIVGIPLEPVLRTLKRLREAGTWVEISTVVVPGANDTDTAVAQMAEHILCHSGPQTPWHLMRFFPAYQMVNQAPGTLERLREMRHLALSRDLHYTYISNVPNAWERNTFCPACGTLLSTRPLHHHVPLPAACPSCRQAIPGRGLPEPVNPLPREEKAPC